MPNNVLAGPILRRTTKNRVCVWIATSEPVQLRLTILNDKKKEVGSGGMDNVNPEGIRLGNELYIHLLQARPPKGKIYDHDVKLYYRIEKTTKQKNAPLFSAEELGGLVYGSDPYPGFFIPSQLKNILHGSCRKPHGRVTAGDGLTSGHVLMQKTYDDLQKRPAMLLLTGDQIYADDVSLSLFAKLKEEAIRLAGQKEEMPQIGRPYDIALHGRKQALNKNKSGFTSTESHNHLLSFGEYAAMYIYAFGNLPGWQPVWKWETLQKKGIQAGEEKKAKKALEDQNDFLRSFHKQNANVRKLFANIPTYMIFDDHDVTEDWNITHFWFDSVRQSPLGRRTIANALAAYWAFQGWGNDPDNFDRDLIGSIVRQHSGSHDAFGNSQKGQAISEERLAEGERYDLFTWKHHSWGFSIPSSVPVIALDTRTQRRYDDYHLPAQIMDRYSLDWLRSQWAKIKSDVAVGDTWPVFLAATPVLGFKPYEAIQKRALRSVKKVMQYVGKKYLIPVRMIKGRLDLAVVNVMDIESWAANKNGYKALFDTLQGEMRLPGCIFLSGDMHFSFSAKGEFTCNGKTLPCLQFVSSPLHNMPSEFNRRILETVSKWKLRGKLRVRFAWGKRNRWTSTSLLLSPEDKSPPVQVDANIGLVEFDDNRPICHSLLAGQEKRIDYHIL